MSRSVKSLTAECEAHRSKSCLSPSLDLSLTHLQSLRAPVPQGDSQAGSLEVWDISRPHILVLWAFFSSQQHGKRLPSAGLGLTLHAQQLPPLVAFCMAWTPRQEPRFLAPVPTCVIMEARMKGHSGKPATISALKTKQTKAFSQLQWHEQSLVPLAAPGCG